MLWRKSRKGTQRVLGAAGRLLQLSNAPRDGLPEKLAFEQRPKVGERGSCVTNRAFRAEGMEVQKSWACPTLLANTREAIVAEAEGGRGGGAEAQKVTRKVTVRGVLFLKKQEEHNIITNISHEMRAPLVTNHPWQQVAEHMPKCRAEHMQLSPAEEFRCPRV